MGDAFLLSHYFQPPQIATGDILEDAESEFRDYGQYMVEYVRLNAFVRKRKNRVRSEYRFPSVATGGPCKSVPC